MDDKPQATPAASQTPTVKTVEIEVVLGDIPPGAYIARQERVEFKSMTLRQATALKRLTRGLEDSGRQLADGTYIRRPGHAIRWLLEQIDSPE